MKLLNLDELAAVARQVTIRGVTYSVAEQSVDGMIEALRIAEKATATTTEEDVKTMFQDMVLLASKVLVDCPIEVIRGMSMKQIRALMEFAAASDEEAVQGSEDATSGKKIRSKSKA